MNIKDARGKEIAHSQDASVSRANIEFIEKFYLKNRMVQLNDSSCFIGPFKNGFAKIYKEGYIGLIDSSGKIICTPQYDKIFEFEGKVARVGLNGRYGIIDNTGNELVKPTFIELNEFNDEISIYRLDNSSWNYGLINKHGKFITKCKYNYLSPRQNGRFLYSIGDTIGIIEQSGKELPIYNSKYEDVISFYQGKLIIKKDDNVGLLLNNQEGLIPTFEKLGFDLKFGYMNESFQMVIPAKYDWVTPFVNGFAIVKNNGKWADINKEGKTIIPFKYDSIKQTNNKFIVTLNGKTGLLDIDGNQILPIKYSSLTYLFKNLFAIHNDTLWGVINEKGIQVIPFNYDAISFLNDSEGVLTKFVSFMPLNTGVPRYYFNGSYFLFNEKGEIRGEGKYFTKLIEKVSDFYSPVPIILPAGFFAPLLEDVIYTKYANKRNEYDYQKKLISGYIIIW